MSILSVHKEIEATINTHLDILNATDYEDTDRRESSMFILDSLVKSYNELCKIGFSDQRAVEIETNTLSGVVYVTAISYR